MCTGHQRSEGRRHHEKEYLEDRKKKLSDQRFQNARTSTSTERGVTERLGGSRAQILDRVRVYIDGYLDNMTDIEMKRIVTSAGGRIMLVSPLPPFSHRPHCCDRGTAAGATHILTSQQLSASKTHKILTTKSRHKVHVVKPEWVVDSLNAGKRRSERDYSVIKVAGDRSLLDMLQK
jgi:hypothetical protein